MAESWVAMIGRLRDALKAILAKPLTLVSPVTIAVALTALTSATLFVVTDIIRTSGEAVTDLQIVDMVLSEFDGPQLVPASLISMPIAARAPALDALDAEAFAGIAQRGAVAYLIAFLMIAVAWRTRKLQPVHATGASNPELERALASVREQQRRLARRYHEEKLRAEAANTSKIAFLSHLSHDIRTPLNHIIGFADLMRLQTYGPLGDPRYANYVDTIKGSGERLLAFFASILELAEFESGRKVLRSDPLTVDDLLRTVIRRFRPQAARAGLHLVAGEPSGARLFGDRFCLERMLGNLVDNAIRFTPQGGTVTLAAYAADNGVVLEVADTGIGMNEDRLHAVSQPFAFGFGDATLTREHGGAGLGISIARAIAEQSGGHLVIDSRPGLGTTVAISLPLRLADEGLDEMAA